MSHLFSVDQLSMQDIAYLLEKSAAYFARTQVPSSPQVHRSAALIFAEASTRTKLSFQQALYQLGVNVMDVDWHASSHQKGESLIETLITLDAMGIDLAVVRSADPDWTQALQSISLEKLQVINAGEGHESHPTQALLDLATLFALKGLSRNFSMGFLGDVHHSRVFQSWRKLAAKQNIKINICAPSMPGQNKEELLAHNDVIMMLRWQKERHTHSDWLNHQIIETFALRQADLEKLTPEQVLLHPGPHVLGEELDEAVLKDARCLIRQQVKMGVFLRMALVEALFENRLAGEKTQRA